MSARFGLLLDVDGPIADPDTRTITIPSIVTDLVALANAGHPIVFNTGRSDAFARDKVLARLLDAGLEPEASVHAVCEKGAVWFSLEHGASGEVHVEERYLVPAEYAEVMHRALDERFADTMFWDATKRTMVSVEQRVDAPDNAYHAQQQEFDALAQHELDRRALSGTFKVDPTIIASDVEHHEVGKALGAARAIELVRAHPGAGGAVPRRWYTAGDSRSDYAMADWLHEHGFEVVHLDVRPADGVPDAPYRILHDASLVHDRATARYLSEWRAEAGI